MITLSPLTGAFFYNIVNAFKIHPIVFKVTLINFFIYVA